MGPVKVSLNPDAEESIFMENVDTFLEGAYEYGIRKTACFMASDLVNGRKGTMLDILFCLTALGFSVCSLALKLSCDSDPHCKGKRNKKGELCLSIKSFFTI